MRGPTKLEANGSRSDKLTFSEISGASEISEILGDFAELEWVGRAANEIKQSRWLCDNLAT
jgi:hypothetical protein